jgi:NhaP-type Na+/H+ or K+/H+ antiporter
MIAARFIDVLPRPRLFAFERHGNARLIPDQEPFVSLRVPVAGAMLDPKFYPLLLAGLGALALLVAWLPLLVRRLPLSLPIMCVGLGAGLSVIPGVPALPDPLAQSGFAEHLAELTVLISLMGAGLKLDRKLSFRGWRVTWRLLGITMPVSIIALMLISWGMLGFNLGTALLVGAALAPTDPVLASDVQVGPPGAGETDEVRFSLTSEAGLNDALAFPFVLLALGIAGPEETWFLHWLGVDVVLRIGVGVAVGWLSGWLVGWLAFRIPKAAQLARTREGFVSLALTLFTYGITELAGGYGFVAVFLAAVSLRRTERGHEYFQTLYGFSQSIEHLLTMVVLLLLGSALAHDVLHALQWRDVGFAVISVLLVRPLAGLLGLVGMRRWTNEIPWPWDEKLIISFFGIRGVGSIFYLTYALNRQDWAEKPQLQAIVGFVVLISIVVHGVSVTPLMDWLDRRRAGRPVPPPYTTLGE